MAEASNGSLKRRLDGSFEAREMSLTLLRHNGTKRVLYMEAGEDFVDLLLSFLLLPVGSILSRLAEQSSSSCLGAIENVPGSVAKLDNCLLYTDKSELLVPKVSVRSNEHMSRAALLLLKVNSVPCVDVSDGECFYACTRQHHSGFGDCLWRTKHQNVECPGCESPTSREVWMKKIDKKPAPDPTSTPVVQTTKAAKAGFVKKNVTFIVTDDLKISPASTIESINLLKNFKVTSMLELESCKERVGAQEALKLLGASFTSRNLLNDVFGPRVIYSK